MAKRDLIHEAVRRALEKDGWSITDDPLIIEIDEGAKSLEIDLGAEKIIIAEKGAEKIAVEVKSFASPSILHSFHEALGQFLDYRDALEENRIERKMFLAVPMEIYRRMEEIKFIGRQIGRYRLKLVVVDIEIEKIFAWKT